ncbi:MULTISPECIES: hypothetical protein [Arthrobacter]|uniref:Uncharacterized protein n=2 Tax=Arthrobacter TaxID=1663 RepID=A0ABU9KIW3_9MICC|nr:hypothetical protein [Arthrobacter sp. YJM1]MDP5226656.1 hypothetical protein [Arthrobacter sp. YJM1]
MAREEGLTDRDPVMPVDRDRPRVAPAAAWLFDVVTEPSSVLSGRGPAAGGGPVGDPVPEEGYFMPSIGPEWPGLENG